MPFLDNREKVTCIQQGINSTFWTEYLLPLLMNRGKNAMKVLAAGKSDSDDILRGRYQAYQDIINTPLSEIKAYNVEESRREGMAMVEEATNQRAEMGFQSPFVNNLEPGTLTEDESAATAHEEKVRESNA